MKPHGYAVINREGRVLLEADHGAWNLEQAELCFAQWRRLLRSILPCYWAVLIDIRQFEGCTPPALDRLREVALWGSRHGCRHIAFVTTSRVNRYIAEQAGVPGIRYGQFDAMDSARQWLTQLGYFSQEDTARPSRRHFERDGAQYARFRPGYPADLAHSLATLTPNHRLAVDIGCGSGQLTTMLADHFTRVIGADSSLSQLRHAGTADNITYLQQQAECLALPDNSVDLIVAAQAAHWFELSPFYAEARRVARENAAIALITYGLPVIDDPVGAVFQQGYWQDTHAFWAPERQLVEDGYRGLDFPFAEVPFPSHNYRMTLTLSEFVGYIQTWSAYDNACQQRQLECFKTFFDKLAQHWREGDTKEVVWPISVRAARLRD